MKPSNSLFAYTNTPIHCRSLSGSDLKLIACASMFLDHLALVLEVTGIQELFFRNMIGRLAFPLFAFLLTEGFRHTKHPVRYLRNLVFFALVSESFYDIVISGNTTFIPELTRQNTLFTLSLGFLMLLCIKKTEALFRNKTSACTLLFITEASIAALFGLAALKLNLDYGFFGMLCIAAMYLFRTSYLQSVMAGCVCLNLDLLSMPGTFLSLLPISRYNGTRGSQKKYFFYLFYPGHLLLLCLLRRLLN